MGEVFGGYQIVQCGPVTTVHMYLCERDRSPKLVIHTHTHTHIHFIIKPTAVYEFISVWLLAIAVVNHYV